MTKTMVQRKGGGGGGVMIKERKMDEKIKNYKSTVALEIPSKHLCDDLMDRHGMVGDTFTSQFGLKRQYHHNQSRLQQGMESDCHH